MAEYIEREDLIRRFELSIKSWGRDCNSNAPIKARTYEEAVDRIKKLPTADVVEVKHGKWVDKEYFGIEVPVCSICEYESSNYEHHSFCPNCGAKMDLEEE